jgi:hypothetical protein
MHSDAVRPLFRFFLWSAAKISGGASRSMRLVQQLYSVVITYDLHISNLFPLGQGFFLVLSTFGWARMPSYNESGALSVG